MLKTSPAYEALQRFILTDESLLEAEEQFPGLVRVVVATRNKVRLLVESMEVWNFFLEESQADEANLQLEEKPYNRLGDHDPVFWEYVWHRAAETILAVRQGHREHRWAIAERKKKKRVRDGT